MFVNLIVWFRGRAGVDHVGYCVVGDRGGGGRGGGVAGTIRTAHYLELVVRTAVTVPTWGQIFVMVLEYNTH